jgi:hypothetical protein
MFAFDKAVLIFQKRNKSGLIMLYFQLFGRGRFGSAQRSEGWCFMGGECCMQNFVKA